MALVTVQRSPTPSNSPENCEERSSLSELCQCSSGTPCSQKSSRSYPRQRSLSECYFAVKGAAVILPQNECIMMPKQSNSSGGDIQQHLRAMLHLLRPQDTLKMAVRLESWFGKQTRYLAIVSTSGRQDTQESIILGIDYVVAEEVTVGLVLQIWASTQISLDGDGGVCIESNGSLHVFKPVSVQAMWSVFQCLHKEHANARRYPYFQGGLSHTWVQYYEARVNSSEAFRSEWHYMYQDDGDLKADSLERFRDKPPERAAAEKLIRMTLRDIMQSVDLDEVTSKDIRIKLEQKIQMNLTEYKEFIDEEMLVILGQMDKPSQIFPYLYLGTEWNASNWDELRQNNVGHILNVTKEVDNFFPGVFFYMKIPVSDEESTELLRHWDTTFRFINSAREKNYAVLVHCKKGISRSSSTVIAYAMKQYEWSLDDALKYVREKRNCITPNKGFMEQLRTYEGILDASRNRKSALFNQFKLTPSERELIPWDGLADEYSKKSDGEQTKAVYSAVADRSSGVVLPDLLVASENILKSGPSSKYTFPNGCEYSVGTDLAGSREIFAVTTLGDCVTVLEPSDYTSEFTVEQRWPAPLITGVMSNMTSRLKTIPQTGHITQSVIVDIVSDVSVAKLKETVLESRPLELLVAEHSKSIRDQIVDMSSRPPVRRHLLKEQISDPPRTLKNMQELLMRRGSNSPSSDSCSLSSGDESDQSGVRSLCSGDRTEVLQRRNSKTSSNDSAVADLSCYDGSNPATSAELVRSCPTESFAFMGKSNAESVHAESTLEVAVSEPVVPQGQVRRVTMQYEMGLSIGSNRRSSPALVSLEKEDRSQNCVSTNNDPTQRRHLLAESDVEMPASRQLSETQTKVSGTPRRIFDRFFSNRKETQASDQKTLGFRIGQSTFYDEIIRRNTDKNSKNRQKANVASTKVSPQQLFSDSSAIANVSRRSLKVAEPGKVRDHKERIERRSMSAVNTCAATSNSKLSTCGIGPASIWMSTSHEGSVKRITSDLESRGHHGCRSRDTVMRMPNQTVEERKVRSMVADFEPFSSKADDAPLTDRRQSSVFDFPMYDNEEDVENTPFSVRRVGSCSTYSNELRPCHSSPRSKSLNRPSDSASVRRRPYK